MWNVFLWKYALWSKHKKIFRQFSNFIYFLGDNGARSRIFAKEGARTVFKQCAWANVNYETKGNFFC